MNNDDATAVLDGLVPHAGALLRDRYRLESNLASGGYGDVWAARDLKEKRDVAIKILRVDAGNNDPTALVRMRQEAHILSAINHQNIVKVHDFEMGSSGNFMVMELLEGYAIDQLLQREGPASSSQVAKTAHELLDALVFAHEKGILHRDIKPENIIIVRQGGALETSKLVDFGIAKASKLLSGDDSEATMVHTQAGRFLGTPQYCAPEQSIGDPANESSDLFSLGLVLSEWLTGTRRFKGKTNGEILAQAFSPKALDVSDCPPQWRPWLSRLMEKDVTKRFATVRQAQAVFSSEIYSPVAATQQMDLAGSVDATAAMVDPAGIGFGVHDDWLGRYLDGNWFLERKIGEGAMGSVYLAQQRNVDRKVAIKLLHRSMSQSEEFVTRFLLEAEIATKINHPHCVIVLDYAKTEDGQLYIVMEYLEGMGLDERIQRADLSLGEILRIGRQVASALIAAHGVRVVHRDLKPENIVVLNVEPVFVKVLDFGIAKNLDSDVELTKAGQIFGTPEYMSPEQCQGQPVDQRSDLYSLGCILYEMISGQPPFVGNTPVAVIMAHLTEDVRQLSTRKYPDVQPSFVRLVLGLLAKNPEDRITSAKEVDRLLAEEQRRLERASSYGHSDRAPQILVDGAASPGLSRDTPFAPAAERLGPADPGPFLSLQGDARNRGAGHAPSAFDRMDPRAFLETEPTPFSEPEPLPSFSRSVPSEELARMPSLDTLEGVRRLDPAEVSLDETLVRHAVPAPADRDLPRAELVEPRAVPWRPEGKKQAHSSSFRDFFEVAFHPKNRLWVILIVFFIPCLFYLIVALF
jgi:serine/threonine protein kinase